MKLLQRMTKVFGLLVVLALSAGCRTDLGTTPVEAKQLPQPAPTAILEATPVPVVEPPLDNTIVVDARLVPAASVSLSFAIQGVVAEVLVAEGDVVQQGDVLARLDTRALELDVARARLALEQLPNTNPSTQPGVSSGANAAQTGPDAASAADLAVVEAQRASALAQLAELQRGATPAEIQAARSALEQAQAEFKARSSDLSVAKTNAELRMQQVANAFRDRQDAYGALVAARPADQPPSADETKAKRDMEDAEGDLQMARIAYDQAVQAEIAGVAADSSVLAAKAQLDQLLAQPDPAAVAAAQVRVAEADASLAKLQEALAANSASAKAELTAAQHQVRQANLTLQVAELALERATLRAPIGGEVTYSNLKVGEPSPATKALVIADVSRWQLETEPLTEDEVVKVEAGAPVAVSFRALPDMMLQGQVLRVRDVTTAPAASEGEEQDMPMYTVIVQVDDSDARLRWNMSAIVQIMPLDG